MNDTHAFSMKRSSGASKVPFPSPRVQSLQRPSILCNPRLVFFFRCQEPFCLQSITDNTGEALSGACPGGGDAGGRRPLFEMLTYNFC